MSLTIPVTVAWSMWQRARGLLGRPAPEPGTGLLLPGCGSVHMIGMRYALDVVWLDRHQRVCKITRHLRPWQVAFCSDAHFALEMRAGEANRLEIENGNNVILEVG